MAYYGRKGEPLTQQEFVVLFEDAGYRRVGYDDIPPTRTHLASYLSTVWLGTDHSFGFGGPPVLFETMRFEKKPKKHQAYDFEFHQDIEFPDPETGEPTTQARYYTEEQASLAHRKILKLIHEQEMD